MSARTKREITKDTVESNATNEIVAEQKEKKGVLTNGGGNSTLYYCMRIRFPNQRE